MVEFATIDRYRIFLTSPSNRNFHAKQGALGRVGMIELVYSIQKKSKTSFISFFEEIAEGYHGTGDDDEAWAAAHVSQMDRIIHLLQSESPVYWTHFVGDGSLLKSFIVSSGRELPGEVYDDSDAVTGV